MSKNAKVTRLHLKASVPAPDAIVLPDGETARLRDGALELRDASGRLLVRYANGAAEISAPAGDLTLSAPAGKVILRSGLDVEVHAARDATHTAGRKIELAAGAEGDRAAIGVSPAGARVSAPRLDVEAGASRLVTGHAAIVARTFAATAERFAVSAERYEIDATTIVERAHGALREIRGLAEQRLGRARTLVDDVYAVFTRRTVMTSKDETSIDGKRVLLG